MSNSLLRPLWRLWQLWQLWQRGKFKSEAAALAVIALTFTLFFWPATLTGQLLLFSDSLLYSYPLRTLAFDAIRHGSLPLWTTALLSGYPMLSMAQLGIGYPLTWFYLVLPGYRAEQIYVLAPFFLAPAFTYAYLRQVGCTRASSLLAGLSFTFGGMMAGGLAHNGMFTNAVMWLPLMLIAIERVRTGRFELCLLGVAGAYSMSVLTGIGQAFLYTGLIALAYAAFVTFVVPDSGGNFKSESSDFKSPFRLKAGLRTLRPLIVCIGGMALAAGVAAFQILETLRAQRRSIRSELTYQVFTDGSLTPLHTLKAFLAPYHNPNWESPYVNLFAGLLAVVAVVAALRTPAAQRRTFFWIGMALLGWLLMIGDHTPLYPLVYHIPVFNKFRLPSRNTFEWSFAVSVLAAFGCDVLRNWLARESEASAQRREALICLALSGGVIVAGVGWWMASGLRMGAGEALLKAGDSTQHITLSQPAWLAWKSGLTLLVLLTVCRCWRSTASTLRGAQVGLTIAIACCLESFMLVSVWWFLYAKPASYYQAVSAPMRFLKNYAPMRYGERLPPGLQQEASHETTQANDARRTVPDEPLYRIYTSAASFLPLNRALADTHNLSALYGFHNAAGYEPLMLGRYSRAFEGRWSFYTPWFGAPTDAQILSPRWQVLDLLNTRFLVEFSAWKTRTMEKDGMLFAVIDTPIPLAAAASARMTGAAAPVDSLSIVSTMGNSSHLAQDETVARIIIHTTDGRVIERELKAGRDTAEWAHERPDVKLIIKHSLATVFDSRPGDEESSQANWHANRYYTRIELGEKVPVESVEITNVARRASLVISKAALYDSSKRSTVLLTRRLPDHWQMVYDYDDVQIYENQRAMPRAWLVPQAQAVSSDEALRQIRGENEQSFDPKVTALLEAPPEKLAGLHAGRLGADAGARIASYSPNRLVIETKADTPAVLVASEINYPGWNAMIDGLRSDIYTADYLLRGVILPAGEHRVEMRYTAPAARNGAILSGLSLLVMIGLFVMTRVRSRRMRR